MECASIHVIIWISLLHGSVFGCDLPFFYDDVYISAEKGEMKANSTVISEYSMQIPTVSSLDYFCTEKRGDMYLLKSTIKANIFGSLTRFFLCLEIQQVTNATYYYYHRTDYHVFAQDFVYGSQEGDPTFEEVCTVDINPREFIMFVKKDSFEESLLNSTCPQDILAVFANVNVTSSSGSQTYNCPGTEVDVCTDRTTISFTYNDTCSTAKTTSNTGKYSCLFSTVIESNNYVGVWNQDSTVDGTNTFRFSCFSYSTSGDTLYATEIPERCTTTTNPTSLGTATKGTIIVAWDVILRCPDKSPAVPEEPVDLSWLYYLAGALGLLFLLILLLIISCCLYKKYGCICKEQLKDKIKLPNRSVVTNNNKIDRQESHVEILTAKEIAEDNISIITEDRQSNLSIDSTTNTGEQNSPTENVIDQAVKMNNSSESLQSSGTNETYDNCKTKRPVQDGYANTGRPNSDIKLMTTEELKSNSSSNNLQFPSIDSTTNACEQKCEVKDISLLSAIFRDRKLPVFFETPKVNPIYTDTLDEYFENGVRRSKTEISLFRLDSGVFDDL